MFAFNWVGWAEVLGVWVAAAVTYGAVRTALRQSEEARQEARRNHERDVIAGVCDRLHHEPTTALINRAAGERRIVSVESLENAWIVCGQITGVLALPAYNLLQICNAFMPISGLADRTGWCVERAVKDYRAWLLVSKGADQTEQHTSVYLQALMDVYSTYIRNGACAHLNNEIDRIFNSIVEPLPAPLFAGPLPGSG